MQLTDDSRRRVALALESAGTECPSLILNSPLEFHYFVEHFNWDDGVAAVRDITLHLNCDRGTALLAYWLFEPGHRSERNTDLTDWEREELDFIERLEARLIADNFVTRDICIDPLNFRGIDLTHGDFEGKIPVELLSPTPGVSLPWDDLQYELTDEDKARLESLAIADDLESLRQMAAADPSFVENLRAYEQCVERRNA